MTTTSLLIYGFSGLHLCGFSSRFEIYNRYQALKLTDHPYARIKRFMCQTRHAHLNLTRVSRGEELGRIIIAVCFFPSEHLCG